LFRNGFGAAEVTMMNWIETPAEVQRWHKFARCVVMSVTAWVAPARPSLIRGVTRRVRLT
jgi:hypothetical protein